MAFTEDLDDFLADFGVDATFGSETAKVIFDQPDDILSSGPVISASYTIMYKSSVFTGLAYSSEITVNGELYTVDTIQKLNDGAFTSAQLSKE